MRDLDKLLQDWDDDDEDSSEVHVHIHNASATKLSDEQSSTFSANEEPTKRYNLPPKAPSQPPVSLPPEKKPSIFRPSLDPRAKRISAIIVGIALGISAAVKVIIDVISAIKK